MTAILDVNNLHYSFKDGANERVIFDDANCSFEQGKLYCIIGASGSGKTTLLSVLSGLENKYEGKVLYCDEDISKSPNYRKQVVSVIYQNYNLFDYLSPVENIIVALDIAGKKYTKKSIEDKLIQLQIPSDGINKRCSKLSGGEQQRVAIARSLFMDSPIILADEPTGNLDSENGDKIFNILLDLARNEGKCVIVVTHNNELAKRADCIYKIIDKKIVKLD